MKNSAYMLAISSWFLLVHLSNMVCAVPFERPMNHLENLHVVKQNTRKILSSVDAPDVVQLGDIPTDVISNPSVSRPTGRRRLQNGTMAVASDDDFTNLAATTSTATFPNATSNNSTDDLASKDSESNETATALVDSPTETPTLTVEDLISLMDDDSIQNITNFIPSEKEQPKGWAGEVIAFFIIGALVLFAATGIKQCQKRRAYSEIPTALEV